MISLISLKRLKTFTFLALLFILWAACQVQAQSVNDILAYNEKPEVTHAIRIIKSVYGDDVSVIKKQKDLLKFGYNAAVGTSAETLMGLGGSESNETYVNRNLIAYFSSSSTVDAEILTIEGHTVGDDVSMSSITQDSGTATATAAAAHGFSDDDWVYIEGANETGYNGIVQVASVPSTTTFTYTVDSGTGSPATGTITATSQDKTFVSQNVTLAGQTKTALTTDLARVTRAFVPAQNRAANLVGTIYVAEDVTFTAGVPQTDTAVHLTIPAGENQSQKTSTTLSSVDYYIVSSFFVDTLEKNTAYVDCRLEVREVGGVFRPASPWISASNNAPNHFPFDQYIIIPPNADVRAVARADSGGTRFVSGGIQGYLGIIQ